MKKVKVTAEVRDAAWVPRWSIIRTQKNQSVAEHSYYVTALINDIVAYLRDSPTVEWEFPHLHEMLMWGLYHDIAETLTGDITGPVKRRIVDRKAYKELCIERESQLLDWSPTKQHDNVFTPLERVVCDLADKLEALLFVLDELKSGNRQLMRLRDSLDRHVRSIVEQVQVPALRQALDRYCDEITAANARESRVNNY